MKLTILERLKFWIACFLYKRREAKLNQIIDRIEPFPDYFWDYVSLDTKTKMADNIALNRELLKRLKERQFD